MMVTSAPAGPRTQSSGRTSRKAGTDGAAVAVGGGGCVAVGGDRVGAAVGIAVGVAVGVGALVDVGGAGGAEVCVGSGSPALLQAFSKSAATATNAQCFNFTVLSPYVLRFTTIFIKPFYDTSDAIYTVPGFAAAR